MLSASQRPLWYVDEFADLFLRERGVLNKPLERFVREATVDALQKSWQIVNVHSKQRNVLMPPERSAAQRFNVAFQVFRGNRWRRRRRRGSSWHVANILAPADRGVKFAAFTT